VGKGVGIGLSFAQAYIRAIGGEIRVNSEIGKGSAFTIELPRFQQEEKL
jgi:signal transduction histidine kinase